MIATTAPNPAFPVVLPGIIPDSEQIDLDIDGYYNGLACSHGDGHSDIASEDLQLSGMPVDETESRVLLAHSTSRAGQAIEYAAFVVLIAIPIAAVAHILVGGGSGIAHPLGLIAFHCLFFLVMVLLASRSAVGFTCTAKGIRVLTMLRFTETTKWQDVRKLRCSVVCMLSACRRLPLLLSMPEEVRAGLVSILRETSDARIVGFD